MTSNNSASQQIADATTTHSVNLLRIEASLHEDVLVELKRLDAQRIGALRDPQFLGF